MSRLLVKKIQAYRESNQLTQQDLADKMDVPQSTIARIESGNYNLSGNILTKFLEVAGLDIAFVENKDEGINKKRYSVHTVAKYIIDKLKETLSFSADNNVNESEYDVTNMKLNKLCYYAQMYSLGIRRMTLFNEDIEAWEHGPVIPQLYHSCKQNGSNIITEIEKMEDEILDEKSTDLLDKMLGELGLMSAFHLRERSHREKAWSEAFNNEGDKTIIADSIRYEYDLYNLLKT